MLHRPTRFRSSLGIKYPTLRDTLLKTNGRWLEGKRADDGAEDLWRVHDDLYDFSEFIDAHPGGSDWLKLTRGTDITEAFETHHLTAAPAKLLEKFFRRRAETERNSPFTFRDEGFYRTLKRDVVAEFPKVPKSSAQRSKNIADVMAAGYVILALAAVLWKSWVLGMISGVLLALNAIAAHNFFHQRDNFRMYYFNLTLLDYRDWRISHALSHHLHTNTIKDLEISSLEPFVEYLPGQKHALARFLQIVLSPVFWTLIFFLGFARSLLEIFVLREKDYQHLMLLPFSVLGLMVVVSGDVILSVKLFLLIHMVGSLHFGAVGVNAAHHHPDIFHDGDTPRSKDEMDWGVYQLDAVMDRKDITGSHFLVLTNFGDHALHHLFPTLDHGLLDHLYPTFLKTCARFGIEWKISSQMELVKGQIRQIAKTEPKSEPPRALQRIKLL